MPTIHCHRLELGGADAADLALLDAGERERAARFRFDHLRTRHVAAHAQMRRLLGRWLDLAPERVPLAATANGKPVLGPAAAALAGPSARSTSFHFNLTHCEAVGYLAIAPFEVGIDVEAMRPLEDLDALARSCCSPAEQADLAAVPQGARAAAFLRLWTRKEAALKAWGTGIGAVPLAEVEVGAGAATAADGGTDDLRLEPDLTLPGLTPSGLPAPVPLRLRTLRVGDLVVSVAAATEGPFDVRLVPYGPEGRSRTPAGRP